MGDWETLSIAQPSPVPGLHRNGDTAAISSQAVGVTCRARTKPYGTSVPDFTCWVAQGPITEVSTYRCVYVLGCFYELGPVSRSSGLLCRASCKILWALPVSVCTLVAPCSSHPGWGSVVLL